ncbi:hypothetical protein [Yeosuana marina]|uniref:hypothetical protein n=1 Tax=Yeosuana marina TaxID=1565536 RepID=UPI0014203453|nr:hypothetical protein [Yeosuana marina]
MNSIEELQSKINNAKSLDFGTIITETIEMFKQVWTKGLLVVLLIAISAVCISVLFTVIGLVPKTDASIFTDGITWKTFTSFYSLNAIYSIPQTIIVSALTLAFVGAFYRICYQMVTEKNEEDDYFYFFKNGYFTKVLMLAIIYTAIATVAQLLFFIPYIYAFVPLSYFAVVLADNPQLSEMDIVKVSFALGNKKWLISFGTMFIAGILGMLGVIACFIGVFVTISIVYLPAFLIYKEVVGFDNVSEIDQIGME